VPGCGWKSRMRHYTILSRMSARLDHLLADFAWDRMDRVFAAQLGSSPPDSAGASTLRHTASAATNHAAAA